MQRSSNIRVRLLFEDCTPFRPGSVGRRKCWFLLNIDACRRVTDVEYCIQKTFCLGKSSQIELLLDDFVLPPFEKSEIIKENDLIRVRLVCDGDQQQEIQVEEVHRAEPNHPSKRKKANNRQDEPSMSSKDDVAHTSTAKRKKTRKERKVINNDKRDGTLANGQLASQGKEGTTEAGQTTSRLGNSVNVLDVSPSVKNGTPKHSAKAHKHMINKSGKTTRGLDSSSSSSASSSEDEEQARAIAKSKRPRKVAGRRKVQPSKSLTPSSAQVQSSMNPGSSAIGVSGSTSTKSSASNRKRNGSGPLHIESKSSSTEEETVAINRKQYLKVLRPGLPSKKTRAGSVKSSKGKKPVVTRTAVTSTSSSASSMSSASSSSNSDENPSLQLKQKQTMQSSVKPGAALPTKMAQLPTLPVEGKALSSPQSGVVKKSKSKSSSGHVRFSSDSDSIESEVAGDMQPSASERSLSSQPAQQMNLEQRTSSTVVPGTRESNAMEIEVHHDAGQEMKDERSEHCNTHSALDDTIGITADGIQAKLLNIAGQKPKQPMKPKQLPKPKQPKKPKDYSSYPPLVGPPRSGDIIAYKILELSNSYTPEVSDYKEGEVINFNYSNSMIELRLSNVAMAAEPKRDGGKFELETEENQAEQAIPTPVDRLVLVTLPSLIEPKLIT